MSAAAVQAAQVAPIAHPSTETTVHRVSSSDLEALWQQLTITPSRRARHLGESLIERGLIDRPTLEAVLLHQANTRPHRLLGQLMVERGTITTAQLDAALADWLGVPTVDLRTLTPQAQALLRVPAELALQEAALPLLLRDDALVVALADPWDHGLLDELRFVSERRIVPVMAAAGTLAPALARAYAGSPGESLADKTGAIGHGTVGDAFVQRDVHALAAELAAHDAGAAESDPAVVSESDNTLVRLVHTMIGDAIRMRASDIHVETADGTRRTRIRFRIDGDLQPYLELAGRWCFAIVARLKVMADLDISEHRKPQDGKIDFARFGGPALELRMVTVPTTRGLEDVVLRLLGGLKPMPLDTIGLSRANLSALRAVMTKPYGLVLVCGPTGCGKTTTLHSIMCELNTARRKIWTAEDPVEITQEGLRQVQVNPRIGWTFAAAMRTFLRADPDVIMIGEMRDEETARIAIEASLTGHLVLSTLHTNSAAESITRLLEIGLDPFTFSDSLLAIVAQRLVRRLCPHCRVPELPTIVQLDELAGHYLAAGGAANSAAARAGLIAQWRDRHADRAGRLLLHKAGSCSHCESRGYHGRMGLHELMVANAKLSELIRHRSPAASLQEAALAGGMATLRQDGIEKALAGETDLAEVFAATNA